MELETYERAMFIRENIAKLNTKKIQLEKMKKRDSDDDFNFVRESAHDAICYLISRLEKDFKSL